MVVPWSVRLHGDDGNEYVHSAWGVHWRGVRRVVRAGRDFEAGASLGDLVAVAPTGAVPVADVWHLDEVRGVSARFAGRRDGFDDFFWFVGGDDRFLVNVSAVHAYCGAVSFLNSTNSNGGAVLA